MRESMKELISEKSTCVLATAAGNRPHCSLMAYVPDADCRVLYLATHSTTRKFQNLMRNPCISLLIDNRGETERRRAQALTVAGRCRVLPDTPAESRARQRLLEAHPHLVDFLAHPDCRILEVAIESLLLLDGLTEATFEQL